MVDISRFAPSLDFNPQPKPERVPAEEIKRQLESRWESLVRHLLGEPNKALSNRRSWRYGNRGSLKVELGRKSVWHDKESDEGGGPLELIQYARGCDWKEAFDYARGWLGIDEATYKPIPPRPVKTAEQIAAEQAYEARERAAAHARLIKFLNETVSASGTPAEAYLRGRGIAAVLPDACRFHPRAWHHPSRTYHPALVIPAYDAGGNVQTCQTIYLDAATGKKAAVDPAKLTFAGVPLNGAAARFPGKAPLYLVEGPEDALTLWLATGCEVWACFGIAAIGNAPVPAGAAVVIGRDNDQPGSQADKAIQKAIETLSERGHSISVVSASHGCKDFNDLLQLYGVDAVRLAATPTNPPPRNPTKAELAAMAKASSLPAYHPAPTDTVEAAKARQDALISDVLTYAARLAGVRSEASQRAYEAQKEAGLIDDGFSSLDFNQKDERARDRQRKRLAKQAASQVASSHGLGVDLPAKGLRAFLTGSQGTGKTTRAEQVLASLPPSMVVWFAVPTNAKALEVLSSYEGKRKPWSMLGRALRGRGAIANPITKEPMCFYSKTADKLARLGHSVEAKLCAACPLKLECQYQKDVRDRKENPHGLFLMAHEYLFTSAVGLAPPDLVIVDENVTLKAAKVVSFHPDKLAESPNWAKAGLSSALKFRATATKVRIAIQDHKGRELDFLREEGITDKALEAAVSFLNKIEEEATISIDPSRMTDEEMTAALEAVEKSDIDKVRQLFQAVRRELPQPRKSINGVSFGRAALTHDGKTEYQPRIYVSRVEKPSFPDSAVVLAMDGTGNAYLAGKVLGEIEHTHIPFPRMGAVHGTLGRSFSYTGFTRGTHESSDSAQLREAVARYVAAIGGKAFVAASKKVGDALQLPISAEARGHFGAVVGMNKWEAYDTAIVIGREEPHWQVLELTARAFFADEPEPFLSAEGIERGGYVKQTRMRRMADGSTSPVEVSVHPDPRAQAVLEQIREAGIAQTADRVRPIYNERAIYLLNDLVCDVTYTTVTPWRDIASPKQSKMQVAAMRAWEMGMQVLPLTWDLLPDAVKSAFGSKATFGREVENLKTPNSILRENEILKIYRKEGRKGGSPSLALFRPDLDAKAQIDALTAVVGPLSMFDGEAVSAPADIAAAAMAGMAAEGVGAIVHSLRQSVTIGLEPDKEEPAMQVINISDHRPGYVPQPALMAQLLGNGLRQGITFEIEPPQMARAITVPPPSNDPFSLDFNTAQPASGWH